MKTRFRWKGGLYFLAIFIIAALFVLNFGEKYLKSSIENHLSVLSGAYVESKKLKISYVPFEVSIQNLSINHAQKKKSQLIQIDRIAMSIDWQSLLFDKIIIDEMELTGIRINMSDILSHQALDPFGLESALATITSSESTTLDPSEIVRQHGIGESNKDASGTLHEKKHIVDHLRQDFENNSKELQQIVSDVNYLDERQIGFQDSKRPYNELSTKIELLQKSLQQIRYNINEAILIIEYGNKQHGLNSFSTKVHKNSLLLENKLQIENHIKSWLGNMVDVLLQEYRIITQNAGNIVNVPLFKVKSIQDQGATFAFEEHVPQPKFLIRSMSLHFDLEVGLLKGNIHNVTSDQAVLKHPLTFHIYTSKLHEAKDIELEGFSNRIDMQHSFDEINLKIDMLQINNLNIYKTRYVKLKIDKGLLNLNLKSKIENGNRVDIQVTASIHPNEVSMESRVIQPTRQSIVGNTEFKLRDLDFHVQIMKNSEEVNVDLKSNIESLYDDFMTNTSFSHFTTDFKTVHEFSEKKLLDDLYQFRQNTVKQEKIAEDLVVKINSAIKAAIVTDQ